MIKELLNLTLSRAKDKNNKVVPGCIIHGLSGFGKTAITKEWLEENRLKNRYIDATWVNVIPKEVEVLPINKLNGKKGGVTMITAERLNELMTPQKETINVIFDSEEIDDIDKETVICIDNYDKATPEQRQELLKLIRDCRVVDLREENNNYIKVVDPLMLIVIIDDSQLITKHPLSDEELKLFGLEEFI